MRKIYLILSFLLLLYGIIDANISSLQTQFMCNEVDLASMIEYQFDYKCLQIAINGNDQSPCISRLLQSRSIPVQIISLLSLRHRYISSVTQKTCQTFLIFAKNINVVNEIFNSDRNRKKQFFPFTKFYFYFFETDHSNETENLDSMTVAKNFLTVNALFGYLFELKNDTTESKVVIRDLLTNDTTKRSISAYMPSDLLHPLVDTSLVKDNFTISLFNCKPFTFYPERADDNTIINEMDGTEFRFVKELTKNWKKNYIFRDYSRTKLSPYPVIMNDLSNNSSDMAMCSIWLIDKYYKGYDLSTFYDQQCVTFLVPKPEKLHEATAIYRALNTSVWLMFLLFFICSSILLNFIAKIEERLYEVDSVYTDFTRVIMETVNTATSHSIHRFQSGHASVKILLTSWILLCMWMGICYTTIYTSTLARPSYEKPINTVQQFLQHGLHICGAYLHDDSINEFRNSVNKDYRELSTRSLVYGENLMYLRRLILDRKCGMFMSRSKNNYVSMQDDIDLIQFRMMRKCVSRHYSGFAFQKYSPYTELFSWHIRRYQAHGIIQKWYLDVSKDQQSLKAILKSYRRRDSDHQIKLVNVSGAFFLLCIGLLLSNLIFVVEFLKHKRMKNSLKLNNTNRKPFIMENNVLKLK